MQKGPYCDLPHTGHRQGHRPEGVADLSCGVGDHHGDLALTRRAPRFFCGLALATSLAWVGHAQAQGDGRSGTFKNLEGTVSVVRGSQRLPALPGQGLREGDRVVTGPNSAAAITLQDGTVFAVGPNASVDLTHYIFDTTSQNGSLLLNLLQGTLRMVTGVMGKTNPEVIKVTTPTSVVGVRGTDFIVEAQP